MSKIPPSPYIKVSSSPVSCYISSKANGLVDAMFNIESLSGDVMVLGKLKVSGRPTNLDNSRARAYCAYNRGG